MTFFVAATLLGFQFGWEPRPDGGCQYTIELNADALEALRSGEPIESDLRPELLGEVRSFRIVVGDQVLPRRLAAKPPATLPPNPASKPLAEQRVAFAAPLPVENPAVANSAATPGVETATAARPWLPLWLTIVALFASLGGNLFLGWVTWDARSRYRSLLGSAVA
jgi:hypothetical protein